MKMPVCAQLHAYATLAFGLWCAVQHKLPGVAAVAAYIAGSETLWRIGRADIPWEFGKYSTVAVLSIAMICRLRGGIPLLPSLYLGLLIPGAIITLASVDLSFARDRISSELSGPLSLAATAAFFWNVRLSGSERLHVLLAVLAPILGVAATCSFGLFTADELAFGRGSSFISSAGFGPNQVSSVLGFGVVLCFIAFGERALPRDWKPLLLVTMFILTLQSMLTLSRCGLYYAVGSVLCALAILVQDLRKAFSLILATGVLVGIGYGVALPQLDAFTGGALSARFADTGLTGRDAIMRADLQIMKDNPVFGVGAGLAKHERSSYFKRASSHTEYTRLLAEHGLFGALAIGVLLSMPVVLVARAPSPFERARALALVMYCLLFMTGNGMRLALPAFAIGLAAVGLPARQMTTRRPDLQAQTKQALSRRVTWSTNPFARPAR